MEIKILSPEFEYLGCWVKAVPGSSSTRYWYPPGVTGVGTHVQRRGADGWAGNAALPESPVWVTPTFATKEECAVYLTFMEATQTQEK